MNQEQSAEFLRQFEGAAKDGQIITVEVIAKALDEATGKVRKSLSTVYYYSGTKNSNYSAILMCRNNMI